MPARPTRLYRLTRWSCQLAFLALFALLFARTAYRFPPGLQNLLFRVDPLVALIAGVAARVFVTTVLPSLVVLVGTLLFGRFFCGFVCPLGTTVDVADTVVRRPLRRGVTFRSGKYLTLLFLFFAALLGTSFVAFFDPLVIFERTLTLVGYPFCGRAAAQFSAARSPVFAETLLALLTFTAILLLGLVSKRFWCRNLCPLGGLLGLLSKASLFRFRLGECCTQCGRCEKVCPTSAIRSDRRQLDAAECIGCLACVYECPSGTIGYRAGAGPAPLDVGRRQALVAVGSAAVAAPLAKSLLHVRLSDRLIRPPGSVPEPDFLNLCLRCGICMKTCPTNGLQPCVLESGAAGIWTPHLVPRVGGCEKNCNHCGRLCPTGAIRRLPLEEKSFAKLGSAVIDRHRCIAWEQDKDCLICDEACQYDAIALVRDPGSAPGTGPMSAVSGGPHRTAGLPVVDERICVGCGVCESRCPIAGPAAIQVHAIGEERRRTGSYVTEEKRRLRASQQQPDELPSGFIVE